MKVKRIKKEDLIKLKDGDYGVKVSDTGSMPVGYDGLMANSRAVIHYLEQFKKMVENGNNVKAKAYITAASELLRSMSKKTQQIAGEIK